MFRLARLFERRGTRTIGHKIVISHSQGASEMLPAEIQPLEQAVYPRCGPKKNWLSSYWACGGTEIGQASVGAMVVLPRSFFLCRIDMDSYRELQHWWEQSGHSIQTAEIQEDRISALELRYGIILPDDFRQYLRFSTPIGEDWDTKNVSWWEFAQIKNIPDEYPHEVNSVIGRQPGKYLFFADYCIWSWAWAISCADDEMRGQVALIAGRAYDRIVANSFSEFVHKYIHNWESVI